MEEIVLASASPRRKALLKQIALNFRSVVSNVDESKIVEEIPSELVQKLSCLKAKEVATREEGTIIAADTVVSLAGEILGKPNNKDEAYEMLKKLSGKEHQVCTGITVINNRKIITSYERTDVVFKELKEEEIINYINTDSPLDKAGGYGIQDQGAIFVKKINGCFYNVMGLSIFRLNEMFEEIGLGAILK